MTTHKILSNGSLLYAINEHNQIVSLYEGESTKVAQWLAPDQVRNFIQGCNLWYKNLRIEICQTK